MPDAFGPDSAIWPALAKPLDVAKPGKPSNSHWVADNFGFMPVAVDLSRVVVTYAHLGRIGSQATATCSSPGVGAPLAPPFALP